MTKSVMNTNQQPEHTRKAHEKLIAELTTQAAQSTAGVIQRQETLVRMDSSVANLETNHPASNHLDEGPNIWNQ